MNFCNFEFILNVLDQMQPRIDHVIKEEGVTITDPGMELLLKMAEGDMRRSLNILQASHMAYDRVDEDVVYRVNEFYVVGFPLCYVIRVFISTI